MNPADRAALEVALNLRGEKAARQVDVFSVCEAAQEKALYYAVARGADHAERLQPNVNHSGPPWTALLLAERFSKADYNLICCGDETLDNSSAMVGPLVADLLDLPQVTAACSLVSCDNQCLRLERRLDRGHRELVEVRLPALVSFTKDAAVPQYVSLSRLRRAEQRCIPVWLGNDGQSLSGTLPLWPEVETRMAPRPRVRKKFTVDSSLSAADRVKMIMAGGTKTESSNPASSVLEGETDYLSEQIFRFLKHHEFI
jgi:electron transfer flavoprotein alpha/beta subunit